MQKLVIGSACLLTALMLTFTVINADYHNAECVPAKKKFSLVSNDCHYDETGNKLKGMTPSFCRNNGSTKMFFVSSYFEIIYGSKSLSALYIMTYSGFCCRKLPFLNTLLIFGVPLAIPLAVE